MRRASLSRWSRSSQSQTSRDFRFQARPTNSATVARSSVWAFRSRRGILLSAASAADVVPTRPRTPVAGRATDVATERSEEHTSELQSLMRTSYAGFCLNKKKNDSKKHRYQTRI